VATDRRADDPGSPEPDSTGTGLRASLLHDCFAGDNEPIETTLPPEDPDAQLVWSPIVFIWLARRGVQPVIMPRWRRLD
jgi:hypothetical protein